MYTFGRVFFEWLRVDPASKIFGIRFNLLLSALISAVATVWFVWLGRREPMAITPRGDNGHSNTTDEPRTAPTPDQEYSG